MAAPPRQFPLWLIFFCVAFCTNIASATKVQVLIRGPDLQPVRNADVVIESVGPDSYDLTTSITAATDQQGVARFDFSQKVLEAKVFVPGVGYGNIGETEILAGEPATVDCPPLAPFATIEGTIPPKARVPGVIVTATPEDSIGQNNLFARPDANGHFKITDVPAGRWYLDASQYGQRVAEAHFQVDALPGQAIHTSPLVLPIPNEFPASISLSPAAGAGKKVVWVQGTVRDESGRPVPNATVYAVCVFFGGMRNYQLTARVQTDGAGRYAIRGDGGLESMTATVVATAPGSAPAWSWPLFDEPPQRWISGNLPQPPAPPFNPAEDDLILPSPSSTLDVTVSADGHPEEGVTVAAYMQQAALRDQWAAEEDEGASKVNDVVYPIAVTGRDGVARFDHLLPGVYDIIAAAAAADVVRSLHDAPFFIHSKPAAVVATGIPLRLGETSHYTMQIYPHPIQLAFDAVRPGGKPVTSTPSYGLKRVDGNFEESNMNVEPTGVGHASVWDPGLYRIEVGTEGGSDPTFAAAGVLAASPLCQNIFIPVLTARHIALASIDVTVLDRQGRPVRASVELDGVGPRISGSTNSSGSVLFQGVPTWGSDPFLVRAVALGSFPPDIGSGEEPLPQPSTLRRRSELLPVACWVGRDKRTDIVMRPELAGYVMGFLHPAKGHRIAEYQLYVDDYFRSGCGASVQLRPDGGFVAGPFRAGRVGLRLAITSSQFLTEPTRYYCTVRAGEVAKLGIQAPIFEPSWISADLHGEVVLSDGKTPALGAWVLVFEPRYGVVIKAMADASGTIHPRDLARYAADPSQCPSTTIALALLPGTAGGVLTTPPAHRGDPMRFVLPPPISATGTVTVAGLDPRDHAGVIHVIAACQGRGFLNSALSVRTTAQLDGHFTLGGLTPGDYEVQAALDDIWLSHTVALHVTDHDPAPISLSIPAPGAAVLLHLRDRAGRPMIGKSVVIDVPAGPLTQTLWPSSWISDGAGLVYIPTVNSGTLSGQMEDSGQKFSFTVPPLPTTQPTQFTITEQRPLS
ncbi:MAG TPA: carboxypeptidase-like regulatory domain-containing protein, partial [Tepidisphaeraceae bacterium]|nr:carboxypeptidase-like regulatory domain-containing protein [Tepidisphaeraceae bacterium]